MKEFEFVYKGPKVPESERGSTRVIADLTTDKVSIPEYFSWKVGDLLLGRDEVCIYMGSPKMMNDEKSSMRWDERERCVGASMFWFSGGPLIDYAHSLWSAGFKRISSFEEAE